MEAAETPATDVPYLAPESASVEVLVGLRNLLHRVHNKGPARGDGFVDWGTAEKEELGAGRGGDEPEAVAGPVEQGDGLRAKLLLGACRSDQGGSLAHEDNGGVPVGKRKLVRLALSRNVDVPQFHWGGGLRGALVSLEGAGDDTHIGGVVRSPGGTARLAAQEDLRDGGLRDGLIPRGAHLRRLWQIEPQLRHLESPPFLGEFGRVELFVDYATRRGHPLHIAGADDVAIAHRVTMLHLSLKGDGDRLEAAVRVLTDAPAGGGRAKLLGGTIVEHEPRRHLCCEGLVVEDGVHMEAVAHPVAGRGGQHLAHAADGRDGRHRVQGE
mmetsp:Transcript_7870/g.25774  ORF Transcript_7870/g.25774 Transcript_7870/m.25774 type:complete len:326 (-) Transcript_7870:94-1071(-)